ncbi:MAG: RNA polymerase sigma factor [Bacteroidaceae bacterium]
MTREQFVQLVRSEQEALRRFLLALCLGNGEDADDIAQETLLKAYISLAEYDERGKASLWLRRIAYTTFLNSVKARVRRPLANLDAVASLSGSSSADEAFRYQELHSALGALAESERTSIVMHYIEGYKVSEVAQVTGQSEAAIKKQLQRGREELKRRIGR